MTHRFLCLVLAAPSLALAATPSAPEILTRAAEAYRNLSSYQFEVTIQTVVDAGASERRLTVSGVKPGKFRIEDADPQGELRVGDGTTQWAWNRRAGTYAKVPANSGEPAVVAGFERLDQDLTSTSISREETFLVNGQPRSIYVVRASRRRWPAGLPPETLYAMYRIDKSTFAVYKAIYYTEGSTTQIALYTPVKWNQPLPASLFTFHPPASAREASSAATVQDETSSIAGLEAPDFTLRDAAGKTVRLRDLRGKVVVVDFWATWCPPCRAQMPFLQQMQNTFGAQNLAVLGLNVGEDAATVSAFAKKESYTLTLLLGAEPDVSSKYFVEAYPTTFVVDRKGRIVLRELGGTSPDALRAAVELALKDGK
jgi:peroxiredoxin/outer membrane lipoprotein-sorting protein